MTTIRILLLAATACLALGGCNTSPTGSGGFLSSMGTPVLDKGKCPDLSLEAAAMSLRATVAPGLPASPVRDGPDGGTVVPWADPQALGAGHEDIGREMVSFREVVANSGCPITFEPLQGAVPPRVTPLPTPAVEIMSDLPPPVEAVPAPPVPQVSYATPLPKAEPVDLSIPMTRKSAWEDEPVPVGVAGMNPGNDPMRPETATGPRRSAPGGAPAAARPAPEEKTAARTSRGGAVPAKADVTGRPMKPSRRDAAASADGRRDGEGR